MSKFYVWCGDMQLVTEADNHIEACVKTVRYYEDDVSPEMRIATDFIINERGFASMYENIGETFPTEEILRRAGYDIE